ncbi:MAG: CpsD/CapB family tyrosine-protein kinase [Clostridia bacterium]|nr:CpsD/CapB family tyrosine-protein kinase [Clostridia bacterium]
MLFFKKKKKTKALGKIVVGEHNNSKNRGGYNRLKDNVLYMNADGNNKVIQVESSVSAEGKTTVISNLAVSLGLTDKKVVLVDLDFRRPRVHRMFGLSKDNGIAEYILGGVEKKDIIKATEYKNVDVVTRGAEIYNSSLVLVSDKFKSLIKELRDEYDYVLLDCPPVLQVSDYIHIAKVSDGVLFLVAYAQTTKTQVAEAVKELKKNGANILGSVFTMYDWKKDKDFGGKAYYGYEYGYSRDEGEE